MSSDFNLEDLIKGSASNNRYERQIKRLTADGKQTDNIAHTVNESIKNIQCGKESFVIYGEPQSGKTEMMIALTAKLLDEGAEIIIILVNDNVQLLNQNLGRFQRSGLVPTPKKFSDVLPDSVKIDVGQWVIFSKKNAHDLKNLIGKLPGGRKRIIIDDEADYATPDSKTNKKPARSRINELTGKLIENDGVYIGVTATPARLDLNRTHDNQNESWIFFAPHNNYTGQKQFFPVSLSDFPFILKALPDTRDDPACLRDALFSFMVNVAYLNTHVNDANDEQDYSFLVHTSGKKSDHVEDYNVVQESFEILRNKQHLDRSAYYTTISDIARRRYPDHTEDIIRYIVENNTRNNIVVMNSDQKNNVGDTRTATNPTSPFTVTIGGNIVSRGVTFENLLGMFFTRGVKHKMQQDTYIQRARMFGSRNDYLKYFELTIPETLYLNWQKCFIFHRLSLDSIKTERKSPVWLEGNKITMTSASSIDKTRVVIDRGEMSFDLFKYSSVKNSIEEILNESDDSNIKKIKNLSQLLGADQLPQYLIDYIENFLPKADSSIAIHEPRSISRYTDSDSVDKENISRPRGFIGQREKEPGKFPNAVHHINIFFNDSDKARVFYIYQGSIQFLKTS